MSRIQPTRTDDGRPHRSRLAGRMVAAMAAMTLVFSLAGCGLGTAGGFTASGQLAGPVADVPRLKTDEPIKVSSKNFTEQILLGKITLIMLKSAGADVQDLTNIPGSVAARQAQVQGQADVQWEYTGTGWISYLGHDEGIPDRAEQFKAVHDQDLKENGLVWLDPAPLNNTYSFATTSEKAKELGISTLSDMAALPPEERTFCVESEFKSRNDGFEPMLKHYGIPLGEGVKPEDVKTLDTGAIYAATDSGECNFGEIFTTDGRIKALDLAVMEDDKKFFPAYQGAPVVRKEVLDANPQIAQVLGPVSAKLDDATMIELNARIDVDGEQPADVAYDWLTSQGFITAP